MNFLKKNNSIQSISVIVIIFKQLTIIKNQIFASNLYEKKYYHSINIIIFK